MWCCDTFLKYAVPVSSQHVIDCQAGMVPTHFTVAMHQKLQGEGSSIVTAAAAHIQPVVRRKVVVILVGDVGVRDLIWQSLVLVHQHRRLVRPAPRHVILCVPPTCQNRNALPVGVLQTEEYCIATVSSVIFWVQYWAMSWCELCLPKQSAAEPVEQSSHGVFSTAYRDCIADRGMPHSSNSSELHRRLCHVICAG